MAWSARWCQDPIQYPNEAVPKVAAANVRAHIECCITTVLVVELIPGVLYINLVWTQRLTHSAHHKRVGCGFLPKGIHDQRYRQLLKRLVAARKAAGLSQTDVAGLLGKPQQFVSRYELGERRLDVFEFVDVAAILGLSPTDEIKRAVDGDHLI